MFQMEIMIALITTNYTGIYYCAIFCIARPMSLTSKLVHRIAKLSRLWAQFAPSRLMYEHVANV